MSKGLPRSLKGSALTVPGDMGRITVPIRAFPLSIAAAGAGVGFGTAVIGDFPAGNVLLLGSVGYFKFSTSSANITLATYVITMSIGSTPTVAGALTTTEADILPSTALAAAVAKVTAYTRVQPAATTSILTNNVQLFDNQNGALELNLNAFIAAGDIADATTAPFTVDGVFHMAYVMLGDD